MKKLVIVIIVSIIEFRIIVMFAMLAKHCRIFETQLFCTENSVEFAFISRHFLTFLLKFLLESLC